MAGFRGLRTCGSVWSCPRCSGVIGSARAAELRHGLRVWADVHDGGVLLLTLTSRHHAATRLADAWDRSSAAWGRLVAGRPWRRWCKWVGVKGFVRVAEVTRGAAGWHVHFHVLVFAQALTGPTEVEAKALTSANELFSAWDARLRALGGSSDPQAQDLRMVTGDAALDALGGYFSTGKKQWRPTWDAASEVSLGARKVGRGGSETPFQLLRRAACGEVDALDAWWEWEGVSRGRRQMTWSRGLRAVLALGAGETDADLAAAVDDGLSDEDLAARDAGTECQAWIPGRVWRELVGREWVGVPLTVLVLLAAEAAFAAGDDVAAAVAAVLDEDPYVRALVRSSVRS